MFTRNYWRTLAANYADKVKEVVGESTNTGKPTLITVSGDMGTNVYGANKYSRVDTHAIDDGIHSIMQRVRQVDVSQNIADKTPSIYYITNGYGVIFGSGNTPPTIDDYKLSGDAIQNITSSYTNNSTYEEDGSVADVSYTYTITNNNDAEITIGEVGLFVETIWQTANTGNAYTHHFYMFERTALESPITIPAGGVGQVEYVIQMNYPVSVTTE